MNLRNHRQSGSRAVAVDGSLTLRPSTRQEHAYPALDLLSSSSGFPDPPCLPSIEQVELEDVRAAEASAKARY